MEDGRLMHAMEITLVALPDKGKDEKNWGIERLYFSMVK